MALLLHASELSQHSGKSYRLQPTIPARMLLGDPTEGGSRPCLSDQPTSVSTIAGWQRFVNPEGAIYYYHRHDRVITKCNVYLSDVRQSLCVWRDFIRTAANNSGFPLRDEMEMVLDIQSSAKTEICSYYLVDWATKRESWIQPTDACALLACETQSQLDILLEENFWLHVECFFMHRQLPQDAETTLMGYLRDSTTEECPFIIHSGLSTIRLKRVTPGVTRSLWSAAEGKRLLRVLSNLNGESDAKTLIIARLWRILTRSRLADFDCHANGLLDKDLEPLEVPLRTSAPRALFRILLFNSPQHFHEMLYKMKSDSVLRNDHWDTFIINRQRDWIAVSTGGVLVIAINIATLNHRGSGALHLVPTLASTLLAFFGCGFGAILTFLHRGVEAYNSTNALAYLEKTHHYRLGHEPLAIVFSLPHVLFLWSLLILAMTIASNFPSPNLFAKPPSVDAIFGFRKAF